MEKVYKVTLMVMSVEGDEADIIEELERQNYMIASVIDVEGRTVDYDDDHPLNKKDTQKDAFNQLFGSSE